MEKDELISTLQQIRILTDECLAGLDTGKARRARSTKKATAPPPKRDMNLSFHLNPLAFVKQYGRGLRGPQKFTLLLARLSEGHISQEIARREIEKRWNKMKSVMGGRFNSAHANRAKANGWVDTKKHGVYVLASGWKEIFKDTNG